MMLTPYCFFWVIDLTAAYHSVALGGCGRPFIEITRFQTSKDKKYVPLKTRVPVYLLHTGVVQQNS
jgi:hypothetical protein